MIFTYQELKDKGMTDEAIMKEMSEGRLFKIEEGYYSDTRIFSYFDLIAKKQNPVNKNGTFFVGFFGGGK